VISEFANTGLAVATKKSISRAVFIRGVALCVVHVEAEPRVPVSLNAASSILVPDNPGAPEELSRFKNPGRPGAGQCEAEEDWGPG
jgi:hypothetical protein